ncbi:unnamed protein product [Lactuca saligna]|uniref:Uncharacterized protein n=1 Tax=Lactuca saligna TaxID=75948 RepID=A0AA35YYH5_LACSI|nr:unnamed protein product [Lactuca saligna]
MNTSKESIESKIKEFNNLFSKEVKKLDMFYKGTKDKVEVLLGATQTIIEDVYSFNKDYAGVLREKKEADSQVFSKIEHSLTRFQESLSKFDFTSKDLIFHDQISSMVSSVESWFKIGLSRILDLVLCLLTNAPRPVTNIS